MLIPFPYIEYGLFEALELYPTDIPDWGFDDVSADFLIFGLTRVFALILCPVYPGIEVISENNFPI